MTCFFENYETLLYARQTTSIVSRGLDAMIIAYSLLDNHPASKVCEQFIRDRNGWFVTIFTLFEVKSILSKIYGIENTVVSDKLEQFANRPIVILDINADIALKSMKTADLFDIDLSDSLLFQVDKRTEFYIWQLTIRN